MTCIVETKVLFKDLHWPLKVAVVGAWVYIVAATLAVLINFVAG